MNKNMRQFDLNLLPIIDTLLKEQNTTKAANKLNLTQSAVSHALKRLRDQMNDPLFIRQGRKLVPTAYCLSIQDDLRDVLDQCAGLFQPTPESFDPKSAKHQFSLALPYYLSSPFGNDLVDAITNDTSMSLNIYHADWHNIADGFEEQNYDLYVGKILTLPKSYKIKALITGESCVFGHPNHFSSLNLRDYKNADHVRITPTPYARNFIDEALLSKNISRKIRFTLPSHANSKSLFQNRALLLTGPDFMSDFLKRELSLEQISIDFELPDYTLFMAWHRKHDNNPAHKWLRDAVHDIIAA